MNSLSLNVTRIGTLSCLLLALTLSGCNSSSRSSNSADPSVSRMNLTLETSTGTILVGETATITARSYDTLGRDPQIEWTTTAGKLTTEQKGRIARLTTDTPGTCFVTAVLSSDGREVKRETVEIRVKPLT
jgi:hypothetical protein